MCLLPLLAKLINSRMADKVKDENEALAICREKAEQRGLAMTIVDAEYQWLVSP